ncbi:hypothetical protein GCM10010182_56780 [Actinomadura cremea]|nr:hypothetical protein GCM10010182_56780 [Actinomadura cremea]
MAPPDPKDPTGLLDGVLPQGPQLDPTDPSTWRLPEPGRSGGAPDVEVRRRQLLQVAAAMRKDLEELQYSLTALQVEGGAVGGWDVAQELGPKVNTAHQNMRAGIDKYCATYLKAIERIEEAARTYGKAEELASEAVRRTDRQAPPSNVTPWQEQ